MSRQQHDQALMDGWDGPVFPEGINDLNSAYDAKFLCVDSICPILQMVDGFQGFRSMELRVTTADGYQWFWTADFAVGPELIVRMALPWAKDQSAEGSRADRSVALYSRGGTVTEEQFRSLIEAICASADQFEMPAWVRVRNLG